MASAIRRVVDGVAPARVRMRARWSGAMREMPGLASGIASALLARSALPWRNEEASMRDLLAASRWMGDGVGRQWLARAIVRADLLARGDVLRERRIGWQRYTSADFDGRRRALASTLVLKAPGPNGELGVLYAAFEYNWMRLLANYDVRRILREYVLVGAERTRLEQEFGLRSSRHPAGAGSRRVAPASTRPIDMRESVSGA